jgi:hypothetical protein
VPAGVEVCVLSALCAHKGLMVEKWSAFLGSVKTIVGPGFPIDSVGVGELHAAFLNESRTRGRWWRPVAGNPGRPSFSAQVCLGEPGAPVLLLQLRGWFDGRR